MTIEMSEDNDNQNKQSTLRQPIPKFRKEKIPHILHYPRVFICISLSSSLVKADSAGQPIQEDEDASSQNLKSCLACWKVDSQYSVVLLF